MSRAELTPKYMALRKLIGSYLPKRTKLPPMPDPLPVMSIPRDRTGTVHLRMGQHADPVRLSVQPRPFEAFGQDYGFMLYTTRLIGHKGGKLTVIDIHDYATVFLDGKYIGTLDRRLGINSHGPSATAGSERPVLEIFTEAMGRINFAHAMIDRKGITDRVTLNGMTLMDWEVRGFPMNDGYVANLNARPPETSQSPGVFFRGPLTLDANSRHLHRHDQFREGICLGQRTQPGPLLGDRSADTGSTARHHGSEKGENEIIVFDLHKTTPGSVERIYDSMN